MNKAKFLKLKISANLISRFNLKEIEKIDYFQFNEESHIQIVTPASIT